MKYFLLIAGAGYYPKVGVGDWKKTFATKEEAEAVVEEINPNGYYERYRIVDQFYDWYTIVDLREWIGE